MALSIWIGWCRQSMIVDRLWRRKCWGAALLAGPSAVNQCQAPLWVPCQMIGAKMRVMFILFMLLVKFSVMGAGSHCHSHVFAVLHTSATHAHSSEELRYGGLLVSPSVEVHVLQPSQVCLCVYVRVCTYTYTYTHGLTNTHTHMRAQTQHKNDTSPSFFSVARSLSLCV